MEMKMKMKIAHIDMTLIDLGRHGQKYSKYKKYLSMMKPTSIKQKLSNVNLNS